MLPTETKLTSSSSSVVQGKYSEKPVGPYALGHTIKVWWDGDKTFYSAEVKKYNETSNLHSVQYIGDKVVEELDLSSENVIF